MMTKYTLSLLLLLATAGLAQTKSPASNPGTPADSQAAQGTQSDEDDSSLNPAVGLTLRERIASHNSMRLSMSLVQSIDTNPSGLAGDTGLDAISTISGSLSLDRFGRRNNFQLNYTGGGEIFAVNTVFNSTFHQLGFLDILRGRRWKMAILDEAGYTPASPFASTDMQPTTGLVPSAAPSQTIMGPRAHQFTNTAASQLDLDLTPRQTINVDGSYGLLRFFDSEFLNGEQANFSGGYDYRITQHDSIGAMYDYGLFQYDNFNTTISTQAAMAAYSRSLSRRLELVLRGGPQWTYSDLLLTPSIGAAGLASLRYGSLNNRVDLTYTRGTTNGSGVLAGAQTDSLTLTIVRTGREWMTLIRGGAALNAATATANLLQPNRIRDNYSSAFGTAEVGRMVTSGQRIFFRYTAERLSPDVCIGAACTTSEIRHVGEIGFDWAFRPIRVR